jgi:tripartite-type tricarboxylate transporter receptor subunit TctC
MAHEHALRHRVHATAISLAITLASAGSCLAADPIADFYRGKRMDMIIGYSSGGTYDLYARLVARHLGNHLPGNPQIVPRNMPGAGSRTAATWVYSIAPKDGTVLATGDQSMSVLQAMGDQKLKLDVRKFIYIGNPNSENNTTAVWAASGIKTIEDAKKREVTMGATGSSTSAQYPRLMNALIGTRFKVVLGYPGGNEINIAMERGEVDGRGSNSWASWKSTRPHWLKEKKINILVQIGLEKAPDLQDVPLMMDLARNEDDRAIMKLFSASGSIGRPIFTSPGVPAERVAALRAAFQKMVKDEKFLADAKSGRLDVDAASGERLQQLVAEIVATPKAIAERARKIVEGN